MSLSLFFKGLPYLRGFFSFAAKRPFVTGAGLLATDAALNQGNMIIKPVGRKARDSVIEAIAPENNGGWVGAGLALLSGIASYPMLNHLPILKDYAGLIAIGIAIASYLFAGEKMKNAFTSAVSNIAGENSMTAPAPVLQKVPGAKPFAPTQ